MLALTLPWTRELPSPATPRQSNHLVRALNSTPFNSDTAQESQPALIKASPRDPLQARGGFTPVKQSVDFLLPGVDIISLLRFQLLSGSPELDWLRALQWNLRQMPQRSLLCKLFLWVTHHPLSKLLLVFAFKIILTWKKKSWQQWHWTKHIRVQLDLHL